MPLPDEKLRSGLQDLEERAGRGYNAYYQFLEQNNLLPPYALPWERVPEIGKKAWAAAAKAVLESEV